MTTNIEYDCAECGESVSIVYGDEIENDDGELVCDTCEGTGWDDLDFPIWVEHESYNDTYELLDDFCYQTNIDRDDVAIPREFKYAVCYVWYKVTEDSVTGPYDEKSGELM